VTRFPCTFFVALAAAVLGLAAFAVMAAQDRTFFLATGRAELRGPCVYYSRTGSVRPRLPCWEKCGLPGTDAHPGP